MEHTHGVIKRVGHDSIANSTYLIRVKRTVRTEGELSAVLLAR
jgi:hypothetical protein